MDDKYLKHKKIKFLTDVVGYFAKTGVWNEIKFVKGTEFTYIELYKEPPRSFHQVWKTDNKGKFETYLIPNHFTIDLGLVFKQMSKTERAQYDKELKDTNDKNASDKKQIETAEAIWQAELKKQKEKEAKEGVLSQLGISDLKKPFYIFGAGLLVYQASKAENETGQVIFGSFAAFLGYQAFKE
jgi:hypothetical protein